MGYTLRNSLETIEMMNVLRSSNFSEFAFARGRTRWLGRRWVDMEGEGGEREREGR